MLIQVWRIVSQPRIIKLDRRAWVTALASLQQVIFHHRAGGILRGADVMHAVAVDAHRLVGLLVRRDLLEDPDRGAMEIGYIGIKHICVDTVF